MILKFHFLRVHFVLLDFRNQRFSLHTFSYLILTWLGLLWTLLLLETCYVAFPWFEVMLFRAWFCMRKLQLVCTCSWGGMTLPGSFLADCFKMLVIKWFIPNLLTDYLSYCEVLLSTTVRRHLMWILNRDKGRNRPRRKSCQFCPKLGSFQYPVQGSLDPPTTFSGNKDNFHIEQHSCSLWRCTSHKRRKHPDQYVLNSQQMVWVTLAHKLICYSQNKSPSSSFRSQKKLLEKAYKNENEYCSLPTFHNLVGYKLVISMSCIETNVFNSPC